MEATIKEIGVQEFVRRFKNLIKSNGAKFSFFLGAGCSVTSGIPTAGNLVDTLWLPKLHELETGTHKNLEEWLAEKFPTYDKDNAAKFYREIIESLFPTPKERQTEIERIVSGFYPGFCYAILSKLIENYKVQCNIILTTNFDDMIADALYLYTYQKPIIIFHEALATFVKISDERPIVIKLHGDSKLSPLNTKDETKELSEKIKKVTKNLFSETGLIFIGYGGNDSSIHEILNEIPQNEGFFPWGIYWVGENIPNKEIKNFLETHKAIWVKHKNFDELMLHIKDIFGLELPTKDKFDTLFDNLSNTFNNLNEAIYVKPDSEEKKLLEKAASKTSKELMLSLDPNAFLDIPPAISSQLMMNTQGVQSAVAALCSQFSKDIIGVQSVMPTFSSQLMMNNRGVQSAVAALCSQFSKDIIGAQSVMAAFGSQFSKDIIGAQSLMAAFGSQFSKDIIGAQSLMAAFGSQFGKDIIGVQSLMAALGPQFSKDIIGAQSVMAAINPQILKDIKSLHIVTPSVDPKILKPKKINEANE
jgi:hypothetical protein